MEPDGTRERKRCLIGLPSGLPSSVRIQGRYPCDHPLPKLERETNRRRLIQAWNSRAAWRSACEPVTARTHSRGLREGRLGTRPPPAPSPRMQGKARHLICRIHAMPDIGGQPLPRRVFICPRPAGGRQASRRAGGQVPVLIHIWDESGYMYPGIQYGSRRWVPLSRFCPHLDGAGSRAGRVKSPAKSHVWRPAGDKP